MEFHGQLGGEPAQAHGHGALLFNGPRGQFGQIGTVRALVGVHHQAGAEVHLAGLFLLVGVGVEGRVLLGDDLGVDVQGEQLREGPVVGMVDGRGEVGHQIEVGGVVAQRRIGLAVARIQGRGGAAHVAVHPRDRGHALGVGEEEEVEVRHGRLESGAGLGLHLSAVQDEGQAFIDNGSDQFDLLAAPAEDCGRE